MSVPVSVSNLHKSFGTKRVLRGLDLSVNAGESFVIVGASGSGKSVFLKTLSNLMTPDEGEILIDGISIVHSIKSEAEKALRNIGFLFQEVGLFDQMNSWENVAFYDTYVAKKNLLAAKQDALAALDEVGIAQESVNIYPSQASLGMQKRIGLARILSCEPRLVLLDEPTSGLDPILSNKIAHVIRNNVHKSGATCMTITHDIHLAEVVGDRVGLLHNGEFVWTGTAEEFRTSSNPAIQQFRSGAIEGPLDVDSLQ